jgi:3-dehydroquinate dehydratase I
MICVSIAEEGLEACLAGLKDIPFAEIRLDLTHLAIPEIRQLFSHHPSLIATCRQNGLSDKERKDMLLAAIDSGAAYVDVEVESDQAYLDEIICFAQDRNCQVIISYHDFEKTPEKSRLAAIVDTCFSLGGDMAKIACMVQSERDGARLLGLLDDHRKIIVIGMGDKGKVVRFASPLLGSPFTFASSGQGKETAPGQIDRKTLGTILDMLLIEPKTGVMP